MLQQGHNVADILYYYGENQNITSLAMKSLPSIPAGFEFDYVNASALRDAIDALRRQRPHAGGHMFGHEQGQAVGLGLFDEIVERNDALGARHVAQGAWPGVPR